MLNRRVFATNLSKLPAAHNGLDGGGETILMFLKLLLHLVKQWFIGELHAAPQCVTEQLTVELSQVCLTFRGQQVLTQPIQTFKLGSVFQSSLGLDGSIAEVLGPPPADRVVTLQGKPKGIDARVAH